MVLNQIKQMDVSKDNKIDEQELRAELSGFFANEGNLQAIGALLSSGEVVGENKELLDSLEHALYSLESQIISKEEITEEDRAVLDIYVKLLGSKCEQECDKVQRIIDRYDMKQIMKNDNVSPEDICVLENYVSKIAKQGVERENISEVKNFLEWQYVKSIIEEFDTKGRRLLTISEENRLREYLDKLGGEDDELQTRQQVDQIEAINKIFKEQKNIKEINNEYNGLDQSSQTLLSSLLGLTEEDDLVSKIDDFLSGEINLTTDDQIKGLNVLNKVVEKDESTHEQLKTKVDEAVKNMMHSINELIARNDEQHANNPLSFYKKNEVKSIQLWANVCYGKDLPIDGNRCDKAYSLNGNENQKLTTVYIYKLEFITRKDVIDYRHDKKLKATDNLLDIPEFDEIFSVLSVEDQDEILIDFLSNCYFKIRQSGIYFEDQIGGGNLRILLDMALKQRLEKNVSIENGIEARRLLIQNLQTSDDPQDKELISSIQDEINALSQKKPNGEYVYKTMGEFYEAQYKDLKNEINKQNKDNVDIAHRQHALKEWNEILEDRQSLSTSGKGWTGNNEYRDKFNGIVEKLAGLYNSSSGQYRKWMEKGEVFDPIIIKNIALHYCKNNTQAERLTYQELYGDDFNSFMIDCSNQVRDDVNKFSDILDITSEIEAYENGERQFILDPSYGKPGEFSKDWSQIIPGYPSGGEKKEPTSYELKFGGEVFAPHFEGGPWVKSVYEDCKSGKIKLIITKTGSSQNKDPGELCKYEKNSDGDILLWKYNKDGSLPSEPTRIITAQESTQANIAMLSAVESLDTEEFNEVMQEFSGEQNTLTGLQETLGGFVDDFNNGNLCKLGAENAKRTIATIIGKITGPDGNSGLRADLPKFQKLRGILEKMKDKNGIPNQFEKGIAARIDQIKQLEYMCSDAFINKMSILSKTIEENDEWYKNPNLKEIMLVLADVVIIVVGMVLSTVTFGTTGVLATMAVTFLTTFGVSMITKGMSYGYHQMISYADNCRVARSEIVRDNYGNDIVIPGYLPEDQKTLLFRYDAGEISLGDLLRGVGDDLKPMLKESLKNAAIAALTKGLIERGNINGASSGFASNMKKVGNAYDDVKKIKKEVKKYANYGKMVGTLVSAFFVNEIIYNQIQDKRAQEITEFLKTKVYGVLPFLEKNSGQGGALLENLTCKSINDSGNIIEMEYDGHDGGLLDELLDDYRNEGAEVSKKEKGGIVVKFKERLINFRMSHVPAEYRSLSSDMKSKLEKLGGVNVDNDTGKISYKNPEGLASLRGFGSYLDRTGQGELLIESNGNARLVVGSSSGQPSVINIRPQTS